MLALRSGRDTSDYYRYIHTLFSSSSAHSIEMSKKISIYR